MPQASIECRPPPYYLRPQAQVQWGNPTKADGQNKIGLEPLEPNRTKSWRELLYDYTQYSSQHGVSYTTQETRFTIRRAIWTFVVLTAVGCFLLYISDRAQVYLRYDSNVNVVVNYVDKMNFPAITVCNQNKFKLTSAVYGGWYDEVLQIINDTNGLDVLECNEDEFTCLGNGNCIPREQLCDSFPDCQDSSDEANCDTCNQVVVTSFSANQSIPLSMEGAYVLASGLMTGYSEERMYMKRSFNDFKLILSNGTTNGTTNETFQWTLRYDVNRSAQSEMLRNSPFGMEVEWSNLDGSNFTVGIICQGIEVVMPNISALATKPKDPQMTLKELYEQGSHNKSQFFQFDRCRWKGKPLGENDINVSFTDFGLCYTFYPKDYIEKSGPGYGLGLTLNVEQYEYVKDSRTGVGIQMLMHSPDEQPLLQEQSIAISPGLYSLVDVEQTEVSNLELPWGNCSEKTLKHYSDYSTTNCILDGEIQEMSRACDCLDLYMHPTDRADLSENENFCDIVKYINCSLPAIENYRQREVECTRPCKQKLYVPSVSFSSITINVDVLSQRERQELNDLQQSLSVAREITYRIRDDHYRNTMRVFEKVLSEAWVTRQTLDAGLEIQHKEALNVTYIGTMVNTDCIVHNSRLQNLSVKMGSEVMTSMERLRNHITLNVTTSARALQLEIEKTLLSKGDLDQIRSEGLVLVKNLTSDVNDQVALLLQNLSLLVMSSKSNVNVILTYLIANVAAGTTRNTLNTQLNKYADTDIASKIVEIAETMDVTDIYERLVESTADIHIPLGHTILPYADLTLTNIQTVAFTYAEDLMEAVFDLSESSAFPFTLRGEYIDRLLQVLHSRCDWCVGGSNESLVKLLETNLVNDLCTECLSGFEAADFCCGDNVADKGLLGGLCLMNQSMAYLAEALMSTPGEYLVNDSISNATIEAIIHIIQQGNILSAQLQSIVTEAIGTSRQFAEEFKQQMTPKCTTELRKLFDDYFDVNARTTDFVRETARTISEFHDRFSVWKNGYSLMPNITLEQVRQSGLLSKADSEVSAKMVAINNLMNETEIAISRTAGHIDKLYYWFWAQLPEEYLMANSAFWAEFNISGDAATKPRPISNLVSLRGELSLNSKEVKEFWDMKKRILNDVGGDLFQQLSTFIEQLAIAQQYLDDFSDGNSVANAFYKTNIIQMDVFYKELIEESVRYQKSYVLPDLLGDIGGLMGLLMGASVITILEFVDLFVFNGLDKCLTPKRKCKVETE